MREIKTRISYDEMPIEKIKTQSKLFSNHNKSPVRNKSKVK